MAAPPPPPRPPSPPPLAPPPPRPGRSARGWKIFALVLLAVLAISLFTNLSYFVGSLFSPAMPHARHKAGPDLVEVLTEDNHARAKLAVLDVEGMIMGGYIDGASLSLVELITEELKRAEEDTAVKAVLLRVNSPGGEVLASDDIAAVIREFQQRSGKPVVAAMAGLAASGGYYVSAPCRWIVANELTLTGSIGVIMHGYNYRGLLDKVGVRPEVFKSGRFKDMMRGDKAEAEIAPEEREMLQGLINETYAKFKKVVADGRGAAAKANGAEGRKLVTNWVEFADGRVLSGKQAYELGFVDELGGFKAAVARAKKLARIEEANLVEYHVPFDPFSFLRIFGKTDTHAVKVDLGFDFPRLKLGQMYFLFLPETN